MVYREEKLVSNRLHHHLLLISHPNIWPNTSIWNICNDKVRQRSIHHHIQWPVRHLAPSCVLHKCNTGLHNNSMKPVLCVPLLLGILSAPTHCEWIRWTDLMKSAWVTNKRTKGRCSHDRQTLHSWASFSGQTRVWRCGSTQTSEQCDLFKGNKAYNK